MPRVWNLRNPNLPETAIRVDRKTKWGNPHRIGWCPVCHRHHSRTEAVTEFRCDLQESPKREERVKEIRRELKGEDLACWCTPLPCHANVLLEIANGGD